MRHSTTNAGKRWKNGMRGADMDQGGLFSYVSIEERVPPTHPLRRVRTLLDEALDSMSRDFDHVYAEGGRESVAPERLVRALVLQVLYSLLLKHIVIIDVLVIAIGFVMRAVAGAVVLDVVISHWLFVCTILLALFIALAKRRHEIVLLADGATHHRPILGEYNAYLLDQMIAVVAASTLMAYVFYTISPETQEKFGTGLLGLTIPFPLYGIFRYLYLVHRRDGGGSPAELLVTDRPLLVCVALWALAVALIIYRPL